MEFLCNPSKIKVLACGRRWGKTDVCAIEILASLFESSPTKHLIIAPTRDQANILFDRLLDLLESVVQIESFSGRLTIRRAPYPKLIFGKHRVQARSGFLGRVLRGNEATHIVVDEAAFLPESIITEIAMPMLATTNGKLTMISTPHGRNHFWRFFQMGQEQRNGVFSRAAPSAESPFVTKEFLEIQRELIHERAFRIEYEAAFYDDVGRMFSTDAIDRCLVSNAAAPDDASVVIGVDWGRSCDYTVVAVLAGDKSEASLIGFDRFTGLESPVQVSRIARFVARFPVAHIVCDGTGMGKAPTEHLRSALPTNGFTDFTFTNASKQELINNLAWLIEAGALRMEPIPELIRELTHYEIRNAETGSQRLGGAPGFHDDCVTALALAASKLSTSYSAAVLVAGPR